MDKKRDGTQANVDDKILSRHTEMHKERQTDESWEKISFSTEILAQFPLLNSLSKNVATRVLCVCPTMEKTLWAKQIYHILLIKRK